MQLAVQKIIVAGHYPARIQAADFFHAGRKQLRHAVQNGRRAVNVEEIAGKKIAAEQQIVLNTEEPTVTRGVARQMDHPQASPERQFLSVRQKFIN